MGEPHQHGLGLIVERMGRDQRRAAEPPRLVRQQGVARAPRLGLHAACRLRSFPAQDRMGHAELRTERSRRRRPRRPIPGAGRDRPWRHGAQAGRASAPRPRAARAAPPNPARRKRRRAGPSPATAPAKQRRPRRARPARNRLRSAPRSSAAGAAPLARDALADGIGGGGIVDADLGIGRAGLLLGAEPVQGHAELQQAVRRLGRLAAIRARSSGTARPPRDSAGAGDSSRRASRSRRPPAGRADSSAGTGGSPSRPARIPCAGSRRRRGHRPPWRSAARSAAATLAPARPVLRQAALRHRAPDALQVERLARGRAAAHNPPR